jgi:Ser/Thr protein kinase RdoA (MazF antagonist)
MPTIDLVARLLAGQYGARPTAIADLQNYVFDWRGIYRADHADGTAWVVRLINRAEAADDFASTARLLDWLEAQGYPAPRAVATRSGGRVGHAEGWWMLATTFVPGRLPEPTPEHMRAIGAALGRLHRLALPGAGHAAQLPDSNWPPGTIATLRGQLEASAPRWPNELRPIYERLIGTFDRLAEVEALPTCLIHADCWPLNAVVTPTQNLVLIDWDGAGYGPPVLDLGKLLLAAHYDLSRPLEVVPNPAWVAAIVQGYTAMHPLSAEERRLLPAALPFWLAFSAADYAHGTKILTPDDLFFQKLRVRLDAAEAIADLTRLIVASR